MCVLIIGTERYFNRTTYLYQDCCKKSFKHVKYKRRFQSFYDSVYKLYEKVITNI